MLPRDPLVPAITVHERRAICKSQLELIIENTGNTRGEEQAFGCWFADELYGGLVRLQHRLFVSGFLYRCYFKGVLALMTVTRIDTYKAIFIVYFLLPQHQGLHIEECCSPKSPRLDWQRNWTVWSRRLTILSRQLTLEGYRAFTKIKRQVCDTLY